MAWIWAILSAFIFLHILQKILTKKAKLPPGPRGLPILGHLHLLGQNPHHQLRDLARKYGPIMGMRFGFVPVVIISSPAAAEHILKTHDLVFASRPYQEASVYISYGQRNIIFSPYGLYWRNMRKLSTLELLSTLRISQFHATRKRELGLLIQSLKQDADRKQPVDISSKIFASVGDMNSLMVFGRRFVDADLDEMGFKAVITETLDLFAKFNLADYFPYVGLLDLQGMNQKMKKLSEIFDRLLERIIDDHVENKQGKETKDFVDIMMGIMESREATFEFDRRHVKAVLLDLLIAGMDTSATVVEWAMSELIRHPKVIRKLQNELECITGLEHVDMEDSHLDKVEYLDFVVKETLRLHPVAPLLVPHNSTEDCMVDGFHIQKNSRVLVNVWAIGRDPNVWSDPEAFFPERFVSSNIGLKGHDFQLIPFGSGRRSCPGMQLGLTTVKYVLAHLVHFFVWELKDGMKPCDLDMTEQFGIVTRRATNLMAIPTYRSILMSK